MQAVGRTDAHLISARIFSRLLVNRSVSRDKDARCSSWLLATSPLKPAILLSCSRMACKPSQDAAAGSQSDLHSGMLYSQVQPLPLGPEASDACYLET